jgi:hypothetical protein
MTPKTPEQKAKKLDIKYIHERDALTWALDKAFEVATEEMCVDDVFHFDTLKRLAKVYELGDYERWGRLSDDIHELTATEDREKAEDEGFSEAELRGDIERDEA